MSAPRKAMSVVVDATVVKPEQGGLRTYSRQLVRALRAADPGLQITVVSSDASSFGVDGIDLVGAPRATRSYPQRVLWRERSLQRVLDDVAADVLLSTTIELPLRRTDLPSIAVVHDLGPLLAPGLYGRSLWLRYALGIPSLCRVASHLVCVSAATRRELYAATGVAPERLSVIGEGARKLPGTDGSCMSARPYVLYVGALLPHKNLGTLTRAFGDPTWLADHDLVLAGNSDSTSRARFDEEVRRAGAGERVRHHGFVDDESLGRLYGGAAALVLPTLFEGFGLPLVEALGLDVPVIASDIPSLREVGGDAVRWVTDPLDPQAWRDAIGDVVSDEALRASLRVKGAEQAIHHDWARVGHEFAHLLRRVAARSGGAACSVA